MTRFAWAVVFLVLAALPCYAQQITEIPLATNDLVYDPVSARLYASVPSSAGANGNSIAVINPVTATVERYVPVGSEPNQLAVSDEGRYLYVGLDGEFTIQRLHLPTLAVDIRFGAAGAYVTRDIAVMPGHPGTVAVVHDRSSFGHAAIYDDGIVRPIVREGYHGESVAFSADGASLFLYQYMLSRCTVIAAGLTCDPQYDDVMPYTRRLLLHERTIYGTSGVGVDTVTLQRVAAFGLGFPSTGLPLPPVEVALAPSSDAAYVVVATSPLSIRGYSLTTQRLVSSFPVVATPGTPVNLVSWGSHGLALQTSDFSTGGGRLFVISLTGTNTLTVDKAGTGNGTITSTPGRIECGDTCAGLFSSSQTVRLTATPDSRSSFERWTGDPDCDDGLVSLAAARRCTAVFRQRHEGAFVTIPLRTKDLLYAPSIDRIVAAIPGLDPTRGNTLTLIDPVTGAPGASIWVGAEPTALALADDGRTLYVGLEGLGTVRSVDLVALKAGSSFVIPMRQGEVQTARDIAALPGQPGSVAVARVSQNTTSGVAVVDNGVPRPAVEENANPVSIAFCASPSRLYGQASNVTFRFNLNAGGVVLADRSYNALPRGRIVCADNHLYSQSSWVIDPETLSRVGRYPLTQEASGFTVDLPRNLVHFLEPGDGGSALRSYDAAQFLRRRSVQLPALSATPSTLVTSGSGRVAFRVAGTDVGLLYLHPEAPHDDVNGDGNPDIVWWNRLTGGIQVWNMVGGVRTGTTSVIGCADVNWRLAGRADFNSDGRPDLLWRHAVSGNNEIWYMDGATRLSGASLQAVPDPAWRVAGAADFNGDTRPDILWRNRTTGEALVWYMDGSQRVGEHRLSTIDPGWQIGGVSDFNGDGGPDLVLRNERTGENVLWYMNGVVRAGYERLKNAPAGWSIGDVMDFDLDGHPDLLWRNSGTGQNVVWYLHGAAHVSSQALPDADAAWSVLQGPPDQGPGTPHDFNEDGKPDLLWHNGVTGENVLWLMNGTAVSGKPRLPTVSDANWRPVAVADFNADGKADILWRKTSTGENVVWHMDDVAYVGNVRLATVADPAWEVAGAADFNRDGWADIVWRNQATGENIVWLMTGAQCRQSVRLKAIADASWVVAAAADFTGDGKPDLLWRNQATGENIVWQMDGTTYVGYIRVKNVADPAWQVAMAADFNGDGRTDIVWRNQATGENAVWSMNGAAYVRYERLATVSDTDWRVVR